MGKKYIWGVFFYLLSNTVNSYFPLFPKWEMAEIKSMKVSIVICSSYVISKCGTLPEWILHLTRPWGAQRAAVSCTRILQHVTGAGNWTSDLQITGVESWLFFIGIPTRVTANVHLDQVSLARHKGAVQWLTLTRMEEKNPTHFSSSINRQTDVF